MSKEKIIFILKRFILLVVLFLIVAVVLKLFGINLKKIEQGKTKSFVTVGITGEHYPYSKVDKKGNYVGLDIDVWNEICKRLNIKVKFVKADYNKLFKLLDRGEIDTVANGININKKLIKKYYFSDPYSVSGIQIAVKKNNKSIKDLDSLKGKKVGVVFKSEYESFLRDYDKEYEIDIRVYDTYQKLIKSLNSNEIDAVLDDSVTLINTINNINNIKYQLKLVGQSINTMQKGFPFIKNLEKEKLLKDVNKTLTLMRKDGTLKKLFQNGSK